MSNYLLDTNIVLADPQSVVAFDGHTVIIPFTVLQELDNIKSKTLDISKDARVAIRLVESIIKDSSYEDISINGVDLTKTHRFLSPGSKLRIVTEEQVNKLIHDKELELDYKSLIESNVPDDKIILSAAATDSVLVSRDINARLKAMSFGIEVQDYRHDKVIDDTDYMHNGSHELDFDFWKTLETIDGIDITSNQEGKRLYHYIPVLQIEHLMPENLYPGDYIYDNDEGDVLFVYHGIADREMQDGSTEGVAYYKFEDIGKSKAMKLKAWDIKPKNLHQAMCMQALMDNEVELVIILGPAGSGKTLLTTACALEQTMEKPAYNQIVYTRSQEDLGRDTGFLPGNLHDKLAPWCGAIFDSLDYLHKDDKDPKGSIEYIFEKQLITLQSLNYVRGRSYQSTFLICDEYQDLTAHMSKSLTTRIAQTSKKVALGNLKQQDSKYLTANSSGLTYLVEIMKHYSNCRIIQLEGVQRGGLAEYAEENM